MNQAQINGILRIVLGAGTPLAAYLASKGVNANDLASWVIAGIPILMAVWSGFAHTHAAIAADAGLIPGVKVIVTPEAEPSVKAVANDKSEATKNVEMSPPTVVIDKKRK